MVFRVRRPCLPCQNYNARDDRHLPNVSISVGPEYHSFSEASFRSMIFTPSIAAMGRKVVLLALNPAEARNGLSAKTISSYRSCDHSTYLMSAELYVC
jgi:hypothetical protein